MTRYQPRHAVPKKPRAMLRLSVRSIVSNKLRLLLTILSVVLGTSFVAGSLMFTSSLESTLSQTVGDAFEDVDVLATSKNKFGDVNEDNASSLSQFTSLLGPSAGVELSMLDTLRQDPEVAKVNLATTISIAPARDSHTPIRTGSGTARVSTWYNEATVIGDTQQIVDGYVPLRADEAVISRTAAREYDLSVGDTVLALGAHSNTEFRISGIYGTDDTLSKNLELKISEPAYIAIYTDGELTDSLSVVGANLHQAELATYLNDKYQDYSFYAGENLTSEFTETIRQALGFMSYFLVAFGLIALLVGTFIIANTFAMIVAQRTREFALLRSIGVSRGQLTASVLTEATLVGFGGSLIGVGAGWCLVQAIQAGMRSLGAPIEASLGLSGSAVVIPLVLGTVMTALSAWAPAQRAGGTHPVESMRGTELSTAPSLVLRTWVGMGLLLAATILIAVALLSGWGTTLSAIVVGGACLVAIVGLYCAAPALSIPLVDLIGRIVGAPFGTMGKLASTNSRRHPKRTATTAFALTLGITLVTAVSMMSATMKNSVSDLLREEITASYVISGPSDGSFPLPADLFPLLEDTEGVGSVVQSSFATVLLGDLEESKSLGFAGLSLTYVMDKDPSAVIDIPDPEGSFDLSEPGTFIASKDYATKRGWAIGDSVPVVGIRGEHLTDVTLIGTYGRSQVLSDVRMSLRSLDGTGYSANLNRAAMFVARDGSIPEAQLGHNIENKLASYLVLKVQTAEEYAGEEANLIEQMMLIIYALLALSVVIAVIGIINTLALNVIERRKEIGVLRAIGTRRSQIWAMIVVESVQIALFGAIIGVAAGLALGWAFLKVLAEQGLDMITIPWLHILLMLVGSGVVGVCAALLPAWKASRTPPLEAIAT